MNVAPYPYISLFAGCAGLDLGIDLAVPDAHCILYVERELGAARILAARMEDGSIGAAPIWSDVRTVDGLRLRSRVDGIIGGFPCTDLSVAGRQEGINGEHSGLWFEYLRIITEVQPRWVFIENVPPLLGFGSAGDMESDDEADGEPTDGAFRNFDAVAGPLSEIGFGCEWLSLRASDVGAPHRRERVFVLAVDNAADRRREHWGGQRRLHQGTEESNALQGCSQLAYGQEYGLQERRQSHRRSPESDFGDEGMADASDGQFSKPWRGSEGRNGAGSASANGVGLAHAAEQRRFGCFDGEGERRNEAVSVAGSRFNGGISLFPPGPSDAAAWRNVLERWPWLAPAVSEEEAQSQLRGLANGLASGLDGRADRLRAGGNGVVAPCGALAFTVLARRAGLDFWGG